MVRSICAGSVLELGFSITARIAAFRASASVMFRKYTQLISAISPDCTPSVSQAFQMKEKSRGGHLTPEAVSAIMCKEKANQKERLKIPVDRIRKYFPSGYTNAQMEEEIVKMCEARYQKRRAMER